MLKLLPSACTKAVGPESSELSLALAVLSGAAGFWSGVDCAIPDCAIKKATNRNV